MTKISKHPIKKDGLSRRDALCLMGCTAVILPIGIAVESTMYVVGKFKGPEWRTRRKIAIQEREGPYGFVGTREYALDRSRC